MTTKCLSCNSITEGKFCSNCSQSLSTHRFSFQHVLQHDFIHGVFHFDKGFFYTIKELFTRPGHSIREYIQGKRTKHFNYFTTVIIVMTIGYFIKKWSQLDLVMLSEDKKHIEGFSKILKDYSKFVIFLHIPIISFISFLVFKKSKQNYAENLVLNLYLLSGIVIISFTVAFCMIFTDDKAIFFYVNNIALILTVVYITIFYYQYFAVFYNKKNKILLLSVVVAILYIVTKQFTNNILNKIGLLYF